MNESASDNLLKIVEPFTTGIGVKVEDIAKIPRTEQLCANVIACIRSRLREDLVWGLLFCEGLCSSGLPSDVAAELRSRLPVLMAHSDHAVREGALRMCIALRDEFPNYRSTMLHHLSDSSPEVRAQALRAYKSFLTPNDIPTLLAFHRDTYATETEMGSPLVYSIRNQALAVIEALCRKRFTKTEKVEFGEAGRMVYWWDWQPFLDWWKIRRGPWRFWR